MSREDERRHCEGLAREVWESGMFSGWGEFARFIASVRAAARLAALEEARAVVDKERAGEQGASYACQSRKQHDEEALHDYANGVLCIVSRDLRGLMESGE